MPDPDLEIREGGSHPGPEIRGGGGSSPKTFFRPSGLSLVYKIRGAWAPRPLPWILH